MPTPFPGMDPYLEQPALWPDVHNRLIVLLADELAPQLRPRYYVAIEERTFLVDPNELTFAGRADVAVVQPGVAEPFSPEATQFASEGAIVVELPLLDEVHETYLEVRESPTDFVVTIVELLSPSNKRHGEGRRQYHQKRLGVLGTLTHFVEIDLLRQGQPLPMEGYRNLGDYRILVSRSRRRPKAELFPFSVRQAIPAFRLPLLRGDDEPLVDLNPLLHALYDRAGYDLRVDYRREADPPLAGDDAQWADALLREAGLR